MSTLTPNSLFITQHNFVACPNSFSHVPSIRHRSSNLTLKKTAKVPAGQHSARLRKLSATTTCRLSEPTSKDIEMGQPGNGIGIVSFYKGKELLVTGGTGFCAKVAVEKILREAPDIGKMYLMIRGSDENAIMQRLKSEILYDDLFKVLREKHGKSYEEFMLSKLVPVNGNIRDSNLGFSEDLASQIAKKVDVIVHFAASTTFDARYDGSININTKGPCHLLEFAKRCPQIKLYLHVSTAYVNGTRQGKVMEKQFIMGDSIAREKYLSENQHLQRSSELPPDLDVEGELKFASEESSKAFNSTRKTRDLGHARANMYGWQDTYTFTKAMGEMMLHHSKGNIPVVIVRPSIVGSTLKDPYPGWIQGYRMLDPIVLKYGMGELPVFPVNLNGVADLIPVDMVSNAVIAAIAKHGSMQEPNEDITVYHVGTSVGNPLHFRDLFRFVQEHFNSRPYINPTDGGAVSVRPLKTFDSFEDFTSTISRGDLQNMISDSNQDPSTHEPEIATKRKMKQIEYLARLYKPYMFYKGRFDISNTEKLFEGMSEEEKEKFDFNVGNINWEDYIKNVHVSGLRRHVLMDNQFIGQA